MSRSAARLSAWAALADGAAEGTPVAAWLLWRQATRLDRRSANEAWPARRHQEPPSWSVIGTLVAAVAAAMIFQAVLLSRLGVAG